ncbi:hypothetical protein ACHWQZ_G017721 [Mnemiopsis leidyi]
MLVCSSFNTRISLRMSILEQLNDISTTVNNEINSIRLIDHPKGFELLPSRCEATSIKVLLEKHGLSYQVEIKSNVEYISTNGRFPVLIFNETDIVCGFSELVKYLWKRGYSLSEKLNQNEKCDMDIYTALIKRLEALELFTSWLIEDNYTHVTLPAYTSHTTWPLSAILPFYKKRQVYRLVASQGQWHDISSEMLMAETKDVASALTERLGDQGTFFKDGDTGQDVVTELDCLVYGHLNAIFMTKLPSYRMKRALGLHSRLIDYCKYVESKHGLRAQRERS